MAAPDPPVPPDAPRVNLANGLTLLRLLLVPALAVQLLQGAYGVAAVLFAVSALTDALDGQVARRWHQGTRWGAVADPVADKLTVLTVTGLLALQQAVPGWFALLVVALVVQAQQVVVELARGLLWLVPLPSQLSTSWKIM